MAAIDPSAEPELDDPEDKRPPRATLKLVRVPASMLDDFDDDSDDDDFDLEDDDEDEDDSDEEDEEVNGGPSEKKSKAKTEEDDDEDMEDGDEDEDDDEEDDAEAIAQLAKIMKSIKGKGKAVDGEEDLEMDEVVICTLDPEKVCS
jgi:FK506-binding nuclear protein